MPANGQEYTGRVGITPTTIWNGGWDPADDYHVYGLDFEADTITWYVDGVQRRQLKNTYFVIPMPLIFDIEIFTDWFGTPLDSELPATFYVDWVRGWSKSTNPPIPTPTATPRPTATPVPTATPRSTVTPTPASYTLSVSSPAANATVNGTIQIVGQAPGFLNVEVSDSSGTLLGARHPTPRGPTPLRWIPPDLPTAPTR